ncbi:Kinesin family protein [Lasiodiplodia theobromae]|uniref:Kinesin-like protein n=1 Tax=Lasiodiplodia theobromae TaxID=45133 RepID=A0A5N5CX29_9PEZI|nr:Kinesin family protein [Lasiodiplodia theobromae]KAB2569918.1 Kinesin-like motor protein 9 [Lasiodiplodia theobromae]KAF4535081.1 Kinesin family protein [Lasiodiplodia theobromae]
MANSSLFEVYLRLRPATAGSRFLDVEEPQNQFPDHITIKPPENDRRKKAIERFAFTRVFEEDAAQLDVFEGTGLIPLIEGVLGPEGREGRDGLLATLGVTGSGKSHTILGSKYERGMTQMALDVLFSNIGDLLVDPATSSSTFPSIAAADVSEAHLFPASLYLDTLYGDSHATSRAQTPGLVCSPSTTPTHPTSVGLYPSLVQKLSQLGNEKISSPLKSPFLNIKPLVSEGVTRITRSAAAKMKSPTKDGNSSFLSTSAFPSKQRHQMPRLSTMPDHPSVDDLAIDVDQTAEYAIVVSMFEVYNDRIFDLLTGASQSSKLMNGGRRRALLFKPTEQSPDRKQVAGLKKIICGSLDEALMVLETGLLERKVTGTGSNAVSSRSHGFFCVEVKKRHRATRGPWSSSTLTVCDLAGSERARNAKTAGETLAEAGKINESLMYLGQCMQMQSDISAEGGNKRNVVPFRQCKLTELLFSNSFPSTASSHHHNNSHRSPQKAIMVVTADPLGDYNATSQILRYSALAREVTVPRVPSLTSTMQLGTHTQQHHRPGTSNSGRMTPSVVAALEEQLDNTLTEVTRLAEQLDVLHVQLRDERDRRRQAERGWRAAEDNMVEAEAALREELYAEYEDRLEQLQRRYKASWDEEADRCEEHWDRKVEILTKGIQVHEDEGDDDDEGGPVVAGGSSSSSSSREQDRERIAELEDENAALRRQVEMLRREQQLRSPSKSYRSASGNTRLGAADAGAGSGGGSIALTPKVQLPLRAPSKGANVLPGVRKQRVLGKKRWGIENDSDPFDSD